MIKGFDPRRHVAVNPERVSYVSSTDYPGHYPEEDDAWDLDKFKKVCSFFHGAQLVQNVDVRQGQGLTVRVERLSNRSIDFDLVGVDASIANAFRRILIAEVSPPTSCAF